MPTELAVSGADAQSTSGLVVEYIIAIDVTRVRFPADALSLLVAMAGRGSRRLGLRCRLRQVKQQPSC